MFYPSCYERKGKQQVSVSAETKEHREGYVVTILMTEACDGGQTSLSLQQIHLVVEMHLCINNIEAGICEPSHRISIKHSQHFIRTGRMSWQSLCQL